MYDPQIRTGKQIFRTNWINVARAVMSDGYRQGSVHVVLGKGQEASQSKLRTVSDM